MTMAIEKADTAIDVALRARDIARSEATGNVAVAAAEDAELVCKHAYDLRNAMYEAVCSSVKARNTANRGLRKRRANFDRMLAQSAALSRLAPAVLLNPDLLDLTLSYLDTSSAVAVACTCSAMCEAAARTRSMRPTMRYVNAYNAHGILQNFHRCNMAAMPSGDQVALVARDNLGNLASPLGKFFVSARGDALGEDWTTVPMRSEPLSNLAEVDLLCFEPRLIDGRLYLSCQRCLVDAPLFSPGSDLGRRFPEQALAWAQPEGTSPQPPARMTPVPVDAWVAALGDGRWDQDDRDPVIARAPLLHWQVVEVWGTGKGKGTGAGADAGADAGGAILVWVHAQGGSLNRNSMIQGALLLVNRVNLRPIAPAFAKGLMRYMIDATKVPMCATPSSHDEVYIADVTMHRILVFSIRHRGSGTGTGTGTGAGTGGTAGGVHVRTLGEAGGQSFLETFPPYQDRPAPHRPLGKPRPGAFFCIQSVAYAPTSRALVVLEMKRIQLVSLTGTPLAVLGSSVPLTVLGSHTPGPIPQQYVNMVEHRSMCVSAVGNPGEACDVLHVMAWGQRYLSEGDLSLSEEDLHDEATVQNELQRARAILRPKLHVIKVEPGTNTSSAPPKGGSPPGDSVRSMWTS